MAQAKRAIKKTTGEDKGVLLVLTNTEAEVLFRITDRIGGGPNSPRKYVTRIREALGGVGIRSDRDHYAFEGSRFESLMFADYPAKPKAAKKEPSGDLKVAGVSNGVQAVNQERNAAGLKVGDKVRVLHTDYSAYGTVVGDIVPVLSVREHGVKLPWSLNSEGGFYFNREVELVKDEPQPAIGPETLKGIEKGTEVAPRGFKVGGKVRVVTHAWDGGKYAFGTEHIVTKLSERFGVGVFEKDGGLLLNSEVELAPAEAVAPVPSRPLQIGDRVTLKTAQGSFRAGEVAKVSRIGCGGVHIESIGCGPTRTAGVYREDIQLAA